MRRRSRVVSVGGRLNIGGEYPVVVQSMLNVPIHDIQGNVQQAIRLQNKGCQMVRVTVPTPDDAKVIRALKKAVDIPIVADIHFDYRAAVACAQEGVDKIRINPGNIGDSGRVRAVVQACRANAIPIRIGVNAGSLEREILQKYQAVTPQALTESAMNHVKLLEHHDFYDIVLSIKASYVPLMMQAYRLLAQQCDYPLHLGVTEAGTYRTGLIKSAMGIGGLLLEGIGDTIRVSLTDEPEKEVQAGFDILRAAGHAVEGIEVISCPTCGRTNINVTEIANEVEQRLRHCKKPLKVAVMGCVVNGPGEAKEADIGIAGGKDSAVLFIRGEKQRVLRGDILSQLCEEVEKLAQTIDERG